MMTNQNGNHGNAISKKIICLAYNTSDFVSARKINKIGNFTVVISYHFAKLCTINITEFLKNKVYISSYVNCCKHGPADNKAT